MSAGEHDELPVWQRFLDAAARRGAAPAVSREGLTWSFAELVHHAGLAAQALARPIGAPGLRVAAALQGGPELTALQLGCLAAGALFAPLPHRATGREARRYLELARFDLLIAEDPETVATYRAAGSAPIAAFGRVVTGLDGLELAPPAADPVPAAVRMIQVTSGSTGRPKGVLLTESNLLANLRADGVLRGAVAEPDRPGFCPLPQAQAMGNSVALEQLCAGAAIHLANRFDPAADLRRMRELGCRCLLASPHYAALLLRLGVLHRQALPELEEITLGTAPVAVSLVADLQRALPDVTIHVRYGLAEAAGALTRLSLRPGEALSGPGRVGGALPGVEIRIAAGEVTARAGSCAAHEIEDGLPAPLLDRDGFLATGDTGCVDGDGCLRLTGRRSAFLEVHGQRVDPVEIEILCAEQPGVAAAVVLGVPRAGGAGEEIVACLERVPGAGAPDLRQLRAACAAGLARHKQPSRFEVVAALPRTAAGKPDRIAVRELLLLLRGGAVAEPEVRVSDA